MKYRSLLLAAAAAPALVSPVTGFAQDAAPGSFFEALSASTTKLHLRARFEDVDQDGVEDAQATTLLTRLTFTSGTYNGFGLTLEMDDTTELFDVDYSDGVTPRGTAVIADPEVTEVNQAYLSYTTGGFTAKYGRQRILLDNQRFVGGVGWRQDEQTYSGLTGAYKNEGLELFYGYITEVNRIFAEVQDHNHNTHLLNGKYDFGVGKLIGYGYLIENDTALQLSSDTFGVRWEGKAGSVVTYNLEYATQSEAGDSPIEYSADYMLGELGAAIPAGETKITLKAGFEVLGADEDANFSFKTPLATLHAFQGWTDLFLVTPPDGVEDLYFSVGSQIGMVNLTAVYHDLAAEASSVDYGSELGLVVGTKVGPVGLTFKYADFSSDSALPDTSKLWLMAAATF